MKPIPTEKTLKEDLIEALEHYNREVNASLDLFSKSYHRLYSNTLLLAYVALVGAIYLLLSLINYFY